MSGKLAPLLVSRADAAQLLAVSPRRIGQLVKAGELEIVPLGKQKRVVRESLLELIEHRRQRAAPPADTAREQLRAMARRRNRGPT